jgi:hypothetical protein
MGLSHAKALPLEALWIEPSRGPLSSFYSLAHCLFECVQKVLETKVREPMT